MELESRCPRCRQPFHCGRDDVAPCPCAGPSLPPVLLAELRAAYDGCLCLACLRALAALSAAPAAGPD
ncbi:MAG: cysteine-rich CWC family protein [Rubrivivax sp.]|nr:cysteine-rich CWC family protein [Rubrivivax sp.]